MVLHKKYYDNGKFIKITDKTGPSSAFNNQEKTDNLGLKEQIDLLYNNKKYLELKALYLESVKNNIKIETISVIKFMRTCLELPDYKQAISFLNNFDKRKYKFNKEEKDLFDKTAAIIFLLSARVEEKNKNYQESKNLYLKALSFCPGSNATKMKLAKLYLIEGNFDKSLTYALESEYWSKAYEASLGLEKFDKALDLALMKSDKNNIKQDIDDIIISLSKLLVSKANNGKFSDIHLVLTNLLDYLRTFDSIEGNVLELEYLCIVVRLLNAKLNNNDKVAKQALYDIGKFIQNYSDKISDDKKDFLDICVLKIKSIMTDSVEEKKSLEINIEKKIDGNHDLFFVQPLLPMLQKLSCNDIIIKLCKNNLEKGIGDIQLTKELLFSLAPSLAKNPELYSLGANDISDKSWVKNYNTQINNEKVRSVRNI